MAGGMHVGGMCMAGDVIGGGGHGRGVCMIVDLHGGVYCREHAW